MVVQSNCSPVVNALVYQEKSFCDRLHYKGNRLLLQELAQFRFEKIHRQANGAARELEQYGIGRKVLFGGVLQGSVPTCVIVIISKVSFLINTQQKVQRKTRMMTLQG